jgi:hypothetical protein
MGKRPTIKALLVVLLQFYLSIVDPAVLAQLPPPASPTGSSQTVAPAPFEQMAAPIPSTNQLPSVGGFSQIPSGEAPSQPSDPSRPAR